MPQSFAEIWERFLCKPLWPLLWLPNTSFIYFSFVILGLLHGPSVAVRCASWIASNKSAKHTRILSIFLQAFPLPFLGNQDSTKQFVDFYFSSKGELLVTVFYILHFLLQHAILMQSLHYSNISGLCNNCHTTNLSLIIDLTKKGKTVLSYRQFITRGYILRLSAGFTTSCLSYRCSRRGINSV
jgi:hypothetical protein